MLTGSNSNFRFNNSFRLLSTGAWDSPCSANLNSYTSLLPIFPYVYLDAVVKVELQYSLSISFVFLISYIYSCLFFSNATFPCHSLTHSSVLIEMLSILCEPFCLPTFLWKHIFFYPLNFINSFHLCNVIDSILPLTIIKCFPFLMLLISLSSYSCVTESTFLTNSFQWNVPRLQKL